MSWAITHRRRIRYSDVDAQGIVFNGNYLTYYDDAITDLFVEAGLTGSSMHSAGYDVVTAHASIDFKAVAELLDEMEIRIRLGRVGNTSVTFEVASNVGDRVTTEAKIVYVTVDAETFRPVPVPPSFVQAIEAVSDPR